MLETTQSERLGMFTRALSGNTPQETSADTKTKMRVQNLDFYYGNFRAIADVTMDIPEKSITAIIGSSGCGKSTLLRTFNRMGDLVGHTRVRGSVTLDGENIYDRNVDVVLVRRRIGMVFQRPNPFPKSIFDNVAYGPRLLGVGGKELEQTVEQSLRDAALWDEVKDKLHQSGLTLSGGQQQRLCVARTIAVKPEVILMDEPCSALDPIATYKIEELMIQLRNEYTIVIVTHNMQQAARVSSLTAFMNMSSDRAGVLVEFGPTTQIFTNPTKKETEDYITGRFG
jgi:phosphate transport system ATP-binding protein